MTFACKGAVQQYQVPQGYTKIHVQATGAAGGGSNAEGFKWPGGNGGKAEAQLSVTGGEWLSVLVGCGGKINDHTNQAFPNGGHAAYRSGYG